MARQVTFQEAANAVKLNLDILDVIGRTVALKRMGKNYIGLCPFHNEKSPSFYVTPHKQMFKCFGCGEGGDTLSFLMKREGKTYGELISDLADEMGLEIIREGRAQQSKSELDVLFNLNALARTYYEAQLAQSAEIKAYLEDRQVTPEWQAYFGLGYAPAGWENLITHLKQQVPEVLQNQTLLEKSGLANIRSESSGYYDRFRNRLMIPVMDDRGRTVAFGARALAAEDNPKYLNSPETVLYVKNRVLYGYAQAKDAIRQARYAVIMEGYFDVISAHQADVKEAVGVCGTALSENHLKLLQRAGADTLYLCFDSDNAGVTAALRAIQLIETQILDSAMKLKVITLPGDKDPDDFLKHQGREAFLTCLEKAEGFLRFKFRQALAKIENLHSPEGRIQAVQAICPILMEIRQPVVRQEYLKLLSEQIHVTEETLNLELKRLENKNQAYGDKKNYYSDAIFQNPQRYIERKPWDKRKPPRRPEDTSVFRRALSPKLPVEEKEHRLVSYLLVSEESYSLVMNTLEQFQLQSPMACTLVDAVKSLCGQWQTIEELVSQLQTRYHLEENQDDLRFLAHCTVVAGEIHEAIDHASKGLKSVDNREKLNRDIADIVQKIEDLRKQDSLSNMALHVRQHQEQSDDEAALAQMVQLREALEARRRQKRSPQPQPQSLITHLEEEQGV